MVTKVTNEYFKVSGFLGMEGNRLSHDIARLADIIKQSNDKKLISKGEQIFPLLFSYFVGKEKLEDKYRKVLDSHLTDLAYLIDDYLKFTHGLDLFT